tara:strand:+ start:84944 stop:86137 length:1194 start_codon:yes stop_codon:yes gene_type:complete
MPFSNTTLRFGSVTKAFHWLTALLILTLIPLGWYADELPYDTAPELARKAWLFSLHKTLGVSVFFVALLRILWAATQPRPALLNADHKLEAFAAETVHWLLYGALVIVPLSGWIGHAAAAGFAPIWWPFGQNLPLVPKNPAIEHIASAVHFYAGRMLILALLLHIMGALKHHVIDRDATLRRMLPGTPALGPLPPQTHSRAPMVAAFVLWAGVIALGSALASGQETASDSPKLAQVASEWQVQDGKIMITVTQFGSAVSGSFADWTADIRFDETATDGNHGAVTVTIAVPSLTLGSVTSQALAADFFDAATFPVAIFKADIIAVPDGYAAEGTLTIKDKTVPLTMPFLLALNGDVAEMRADLMLDRRDFGIGDNLADDSNLAFGVAINTSLHARRAE